MTKLQARLVEQHQKNIDTIIHTDSEIARLESERKLVSDENICIRECLKNQILKQVLTTPLVLFGTDLVNIFIDESHLARPLIIQPVKVTVAYATDESDN